MIKFGNGTITITILGYTFRIESPNANGIGKVYARILIQERGAAVEVARSTIKPLALALVLKHKETFVTEWDSLGTSVPDTVGIECLARGEKYKNSGIKNPYSDAVTDVLTETKTIQVKQGTDSMFG